MSEGSASAPAPETPRRLEESSSSQQLDDEGNPIVEWPEPKTPLGRLQRRMWLWLDDPTSSPAARHTTSFMMVVILLSIMNFTIASNPEYMWYTDVWINATTGDLIVGSNATPSLRGQGAYLSDGPRRVSSILEENRPGHFEVETFCIVIFTAEYFLRLFASPQGPGVFNYLTGIWNIVDFISFLPFYVELVMTLIGSGGSDLSVLSVLRLIRLTRITRIFKMSKNFEGLIMLLRSLRKSGSALLMLFAFMLISGVLFATLIFTVEGGTYDEFRMQYVREDGSISPFESIPGSLWWTIVTMTTVGYGDQYPVTTWGKIIAVMTMFCGLVVLSLPITIIGANFDDEYRELRKRTQDAKERERRKERQALLLHRQATAAARVTPSKGTSTPAEAPLTYPPGSPVVGGSDPDNDPIKLIQTMIHEAHYALTQDMDRLMAEHENKLRSQIKQVLRRHAAGIDLRSTPLEQMKTPAAEEPY